MTQRKHVVTGNKGFALRMIYYRRAVVIDGKLRRKSDYVLLYSHVEDLFRGGYVDRDLELTKKGLDTVRWKLTRTAEWHALKKAPYGRFFRPRGHVFIACHDPKVHITRDAMELLVEAGKMECIPSLQIWTRRPKTV